MTPTAGLRVPDGRQGPGPMPSSLVEGLSGPGKAFVEQVWDRYTGWNVSSLVLLRESGVLLDQLETERGTKTERATQRLLLAVLSALRLD